MDEWHIALPMYGVTTHACAAQNVLLECLSSILVDLGWVEDIRLVAPKAPLREHWLDPRLLLSQTCGYPLMTELRDQVTLLAIPRYLCEGCTGNDYSSRFVVRAEDRALVLGDYRGRIAAVNTIDSNSGMNVFRHAVAPLSHEGSFFSDVLLSGSHVNSLRLLQTGRVDIVSIDAVTWALLEDGEPERLTGLHTLGFSEKSPTLPLIGSRHLTLARQHAIRTALGRLESRNPDLLAPLFISGFSAADALPYQRILGMETDARQAGLASLTSPILIR